MTGSDARSPDNLRCRTDGVSFSLEGPCAGISAVTAIWQSVYAVEGGGAQAPRIQR